MTTTDRKNVRHAVRVPARAGCLALGLLAWLGLVPGSALAHAPVGGASTTSPVVIDSSASFLPLLSRTVTFPADTAHRCAVTASSDANNPANGTDNRYVFGIALNTAIPSSATLRTIDFDDNFGIDDMNVLAIGSAAAFVLPGGTPQTIRWMARKADSGDKALTVTDSSMSIVCSHDGL